MHHSIDDIFEEGCFVERREIERMLERLRTRKNLILQGSPGTGKTWLAKRLAFALIGERDERKVRAVQFHPNLSCEDFVRGWRPVGDGKLALADGVFMETLRAASADSSVKFAVAIEETNLVKPPFVHESWANLEAMASTHEWGIPRKCSLAFPHRAAGRLHALPEVS